MMKAKMRVMLLMTVALTFGFLGPTDASCDLKNGDTAVCQKLEDAKNIDSKNFTTLKTSVTEKTLSFSSLKSLPPSIKNLDLSDGRIEVVEPGTFSKMKGLLDLAMSDNYISQFKASSLDGLDRLKNFNLRRNNIRQLPMALTKLKSLKNLEISGNPLACNCDTLRVRDELLANGVKISKKVICVTPSNLKGVSLLEPESEVICMFEEQDDEMQGDQAAGSGDAEDELPELTEVPPVPDLKVPDDTDLAPEIITDDLILPSFGRMAGGEVPQPKKETSTESSSTSDSSSSSSSSADEDSEFTFTNEDDDLIVQGSGETEPEEEGSGGEGSGIFDIWKPTDPSDFEETTGSSTTEQPASTTLGWIDAIWIAITGDDSSDGGNETEKSMTDEGFINVTSSTQAPLNPRLGVNPMIPNFTEEEVVTKKADVLDAAVTSTSDPNAETKPGKTTEDFSPTGKDDDATIDDRGEASTRQTKRSMGSYVVLAALLAVLAALVGFAAYKSSFCKKKPRNDPERGTEFKDMQKSLLETNDTNQAKISSNGNAESAPLVDQNQDAWAGPKEIRGWEHSAAPAVDNGNKYTPPSVESTDPVKPPRKSLPPQEETNGSQDVKTHAPMSTFAPRTNGAADNTPPNSPSSVVNDGNRSPPLSPNAQRVKITLQENPDSVPKTPILITRTKPGVNLVKTP